MRDMEIKMEKVLVVKKGRGIYFKVLVEMLQGNNYYLLIFLKLYWINLEYCILIFIVKQFIDIFSNLLVIIIDNLLIMLIRFSV